jgi:hypothetical protein
MRECKLDICALNHEGYCSSRTAEEVCKAEKEKDLKEYKEE